MLPQNLQGNIKSFMILMIQNKDYRYIKLYVEIDIRQLSISQILPAFVKEFVINNLKEQNIYLPQMTSLKLIFTKISLKSIFYMKCQQSYRYSSRTSYSTKENSALRYMVSNLAQVLQKMNNIWAVTITKLKIIRNKNHQKLDEKIKGGDGLMESVLS